jgi:outer membrane protein OmpA-like peptidoglycan-associated protein
MTSLAVIFVLLLVVFLKQAHDQAERAKDELQGELTPLLTAKDLALKQDPDDPLSLQVTVGENLLRFPVGGASLSPAGAGFISNFFTGFAAKVCDPTLREKIDSIVIEGHTDQSGERTGDGVRRNIELSQRRSYSVLERALASVETQPAVYECLLKLASASGRGSRSPVLTNGVYQPDLSRRVEIRIRVRSAEQQFRRLAKPPRGR